MAHLLRTKSLFPNKRKGNVVAREDVQNVKRVCTDLTRCVSESECDSEQDTDSAEQPSRQQNTATRQRKKKKMTMTKEEKALVTVQVVSITPT